MSKLDKIKEYDIIRVIATVLVLIGHCTYYSISTQYGGINYTDIINNYGLSNAKTYSILCIVVRLIYSFHMPLFFALSGALYCLSLNNPKKQLFGIFVVNKFYRLIVPFVIITLFYSVPIKYFSGYYEKSIDIWSDVIVGQLLIQGNTHLWFLLTLFFIFVIAYFIEKIEIIPKIKIIIIFTMYLFAFKLEKVVLVFDICVYLFWFYFGYYFEKKRSYLNKFINNNKLLLIIISVPSFFISFCVMQYLNKDIDALGKIKYCISSSITAVLGCAIVYIFAHELSIYMNKLNNSNLYQIILRNSFGIYLYSDPINYLVLNIIYKVFSINIFANEVGVIFIFVVRTYSTMIIPIIMLKVLRKFKLKYIY